MNLTEPENSKDLTKVVLLGTGTPIADPERSGPSMAIVVNDSPYLIDFGPGVVRRAAAAESQKGIKGLNVKKLTRAFLTHLHSDHTAGYPDLILTPWVLGRDEPLLVYGPEGLKDMTEHVLAAYQSDIHLRLYGLEPANNQGHRVFVQEIKPGLVYQDTNVTVEAFAVKHGSWPQAFGYKFITPDKTIVVSGDTAPTESVSEKCKGCDILIHEVYSQVQIEKLSEIWQRYHHEFHTAPHELAEIASRAQPGLLILYHQMFWGATEEQLLAELQQNYKGQVVSGKDLDVF